MTINQHINHGAIQNVCHLHNCIFHVINLGHTLSILFPCILLPMKNNKLWNERKEDFLYIWLLQRITLHQRRQNRIFRRLHILDAIAFLDAHLYIKQPILTKYQNYHIFVRILYSYLRYTDRLLDEFFLLLAVNQGEKINLQKKHIEELYTII